MNKKISYQVVKNYSNKLKKIILKSSFECGVSVHIGGALSIVEIMSVLYSGILRLKIKNPDRFILSKGHGFLALLGALYLKNRKQKDLLSFQQNEASI